MRVVLFDAHDGVLISADALWANGFGVVFPELDGERAFDDVAAVLETIERLAPRVVIPGHGAPFADVAGALQRARTRLTSFVADPSRHVRHGAKVLLKYHAMEERATTLPQLRAWCATTPLWHRLWQRLGSPQGDAPAWGVQVGRELAAQGALRIEGERVIDV
jgi:glyoxylase-like metal-dependent hydrolase (beta-lactamase superfamily II)